MPDVAAKTHALVLLLAGHREKELRASSLKEKLRGLEVEETAAILNLICTKAGAKNPSYVKAYNALPGLLRSLALSREDLLKLRAVARQNDYFELLQMIITLPPKKKPPDILESEQDPLLKELTLGERKSLAKTLRFDLLKKLVREQDPAVIRTLLLNPRLTETEVLKIASLQPTSPEILEEIFRSPKWIARYRVKKAIVCNPFCPPSIALYLLKFMVVSDLREIARDENLHLAVHNAAHQLLGDEA